MEYNDDYLDELLDFTDDLGKDRRDYVSRSTATWHAPVGYTSSPSEVVTKWLKHCNLDQYKERLVIL